MPVLAQLLFDALGVGTPAEKTHAFVEFMPLVRDAILEHGLDVKLQLRNAALDKGESMERVEAIMREALAAGITELAVAEASPEKLDQYQEILARVAGGPITHLQVVSLSEDPLAQLEVREIFRKKVEEIVRLMIAGEPVPERLVFWSAGSDIPRVVGWAAARKIEAVMRSRLRREALAIIAKYHDVLVAAFRRQGNERYASMDPSPERDRLVEQHIKERMTHLGRLAKGHYWIGTGTSLARSQPMRYAAETAMDYAENRFAQNGGVDGDPAYRGFVRTIEANKALHDVPVKGADRHLVEKAVAARAKAYTLAQYQQEFLVETFGIPAYERVTMQAATYDQSDEVLGPIQGFMRTANRDTRPMAYTPRVEAAIYAFSSRLAEDAAAISTGLTGIPGLEGLSASTMPAQENLANLTTHPALVPRAQQLVWERGDDGVWRLPPWRPGAVVENPNPRNIRLEEVSEGLELLLAESSSWAVPPSQLEEVQTALGQRFSSVNVQQTMLDEVSPPGLEDKRAIPASGGRVEEGGIPSGGQIALTMRGVTEGIAIAERIGGEEARGLATQMAVNDIVGILASEGWRFADIEEGAAAVRSQARLMRSVPFGAELDEEQRLTVDHDVRRVEETLAFYRAFLDEHRPGLYEVLMETPRARQARRDYAEAILRLHSNPKFVNYVAGQIDLEVNRELLKDVRQDVIRYLQFRYIQRAG